MYHSSTTLFPLCTLRTSINSVNLETFLLQKQILYSPHKTVFLSLTIEFHCWHQILPSPTGFSVCGASSQGERPFHGTCVCTIQLSLPSLSLYNLPFWTSAFSLCMDSLCPWIDWHVPKTEPGQCSLSLYNAAWGWSWYYRTQWRNYGICRDTTLWVTLLFCLSYAQCKWRQRGEMSCPR